MSSFLFPKKSINPSIKILTLCLLLVYFFQSDLSASTKLSGVLRWPSSSIRSISGNENYLINSKGNILSIFSMESGELLKSVELELKEGIRALSLDPERKLIYLACGVDGLRVVNFNNVNNLQITKYDINPENAGEKDGDGNLILHNFIAVGVFYFENKLYTADFMYGLRVFDIDESGNLEEIANYREGNEEASGGYLNLFVHKEAGKTLISVLDKYYGYRLFEKDSEEELKLVESFDMRSKSYYGQLALVTGLWAEGPRAYITDEENGLSVLHLFNGSISQRDKLKIIKEGQCRTKGRASDIFVDSGLKRAFIADTKDGLSVISLENLLSNEGLKDSDFKEDESLTDGIMGSYSLWKEKNKNLLYLASYENGLNSIVLKEKKSELLKDYKALLDIRKLAKKDSLLILADHGLTQGLRLLDISALNDNEAGKEYFPMQLKEYRTKKSPLFLDMDKDMLFTSEGEGGLGIYRIKGKDLEYISQIEGKNILETRSLEGTLYAIAKDEGLLVYNLDSYKNPALKQNLAKYKDAKTMFLDGDFLWLADKQYLYCLDIKNSLNEVSYYKIENSEAIWADKDFLLTANGREGISILYKATGEIKKLKLKDGAEAMHLFIDNKIAFISSASGGIQLLDLDKIEAGIETDLLSYGRSRFALKSENNIYIADSKGGLAVFALIESRPSEPFTGVETSSSSCFINSLSGSRR